jgi:uncharacterized low-complexity protein
MTRPEVYMSVRSRIFLVAFALIFATSCKPQAEPAPEPGTAAAAVPAVESPGAPAAPQAQPPSGECAHAKAGGGECGCGKGECAHAKAGGGECGCGNPDCPHRKTAAEATGE